MVKQSLKQSWSVRALLGWMTMWMLALPLVHVHPEADHRHGLPGHVHGGTYHTVLSPQPPCAFAAHRHHHDWASQEESFGSSESTGHSFHGFEHPTITFAVLNSSSGQTLEQPPFTAEVLGRQGTIPEAPSIHCPTLNSNWPTPSRLLVKRLSPRAPPLFST